ncbi:hypothetical protein V8C86DRAFT_2440650 [Haematococcus lacustris]
MPRLYQPQQGVGRRVGSGGRAGSPGPHAVVNNSTGQTPEKATAAHSRQGQGAAAPAAWRPPFTTLPGGTLRASCSPDPGSQLQGCLVAGCCPAAQPAPLLVAAPAAALTLPAPACLPASRGHQGPWQAAALGARLGLDGGRPAQLARLKGPGAGAGLQPGHRGIYQLLCPSWTQLPRLGLTQLSKAVQTFEVMTSYEIVVGHASGTLCPMSCAQFSRHRDIPHLRLHRMTLHLAALHVASAIQKIPCKHHHAAC